jgi:Protein of unknown function (DUF2794)
MLRQTTTLFRLADHRQKPRTIYFDRCELNQLLALYSRHVIRGEWRDYAIDHRDGFASFSIFRHSRESPTFTIMKCATGSDRHGEFIVLCGRHKVSSAKTLADALKVFRVRPSLVGG